MRYLLPYPLRIAVVTGAFVLGAGSAQAASNQLDRALGSQGELYAAVSGTYGELFGTESRVDPQTPVLALDVTLPDGTGNRLLVPGTDDENDALESSASLVYDNASRSLFLVWESRHNSIHRILNLVGFDGTEWAEPLRIISNSFAIKGPIQLAITRDSFHVPTAGSTSGWQTVSRAVLHLLWWEERATGHEILYAPLILSGGSYESSEPVLFRLNDFDGVTAEADGPMSLSLIRTPAMQQGRDHRSILLGLTNHETNRFVTLEVTVLPGELSYLADLIRGNIVEFSATLDPQTPQIFADFIRGNIVEFSSALNRQTLSLLGDAVYRDLLTELESRGASDMEAIADKIRGNIVEFSTGLFAGEDLRLYDDPDFSVHELQSRLSLPNGEEELSTHHLVFHAVSNREAPELKRDVTAVFLSDSGRDAIVVWEGAERLRYLETDGEGWSEARSLLLVEGLLDLDQAYKVLAERTRNR